MSAKLDKLVLLQGRTKDFGNNKDRANPVIVNVASGIPCGVAAKSGNDVDAIGIVFLQAPSAVFLDAIAYSGLPTSQARSHAAHIPGGTYSVGNIPRSSNA